jgi:hypothetical protein
MLSSSGFWEENENIGDGEDEGAEEAENDVEG